MQPPSADGHEPEFPKWPLFALALVVFVDAVDVSILRGVLPLLEEDWGLSDLQLGSLGFAFIFVNTLASIPAGFVADRYRRNRVIGWTMLTWSACSVVAAGSLNFIHLFVARGMLGFGQAIDDPASSSMLGDFYPARMRGRIFSVQQVAGFVGSGIGIALGGAVGSALGWRWAFLLVGVPGSVIGFLIFRLREPVRGEADRIAHGHAARAVEERPASRLGEGGVGAYLRNAVRELNAEIRGIFRIRTMRYILVGISTLLFTVSGVGYWLPIYHQRYSGMTATQATSATAGILAFAGIIGTLWGGSIADRVFSRGPKGRIVLVATAIMVCTGLFIVSWNMPVIPIRLALQFFGTMAITSAFPALRAAMMDVVPAENRGVSTSAFALTSALFGTALAPPLVGALSDATSLLTAFYIVMPPIFIGTMVLLRARKTVEEDAAAMIQAMLARASAE